MVKKKTDFSSRIMQQIKKDHVKIKPRAYFVLGSVLTGMGLVGAMVLAAFFVHLAFFRVRVHGPFGYLGFGQAGIVPFLAVFPWLPLGFAIVGLAGGFSILKKYDISYKKGFAGFVAVLVIAIVVFGFLLDLAGFGERVGKAELFRPLYKGEFMGNEWVVGEISSIENDEFTLITPNGDKVVVKWSEETMFSHGADFEKGERVRVIGEWDEDEFFAEGVGKRGMHFMMMNPDIKGVRDMRGPKRIYR